MCATERSTPTDPASPSIENGQIVDRKLPLYTNCTGYMHGCLCASCTRRDIARAMFLNGREGRRDA